MSAAVAPPRISAQCDRCQTHLIAPEWSEYIGPSEMIHIWRCPICGHEFETVDNRSEQTVSEAEAIEDFFPSLLVA
jgi:Zn ribbon nucleic-acid-binding protein